MVKCRIECRVRRDRIGRWSHPMNSRSMGNWCGSGNNVAVIGTFAATGSATATLSLIASLCDWLRPLVSVNCA